jgi:DNA-binding NarL/FixJ family response regulator
VSARVLIVDDHAAVRQAIRAILLQHVHSFEVCEEATNGKEAVEQVAKLGPDIVLLDINMPVMDGFHAAQEIRRISPQTKIVFLSMFDGPTIMQFGRMWSDAFVSKSSAGNELIPTLERLIEEQLPQIEVSVKSHRRSARSSEAMERSRS